ncbi:MAG: glycoside hydrolase family 3 N-terminal domain-containing protein [Ginsengibacter sp.]
MNLKGKFFYLAAFSFLFFSQNAKSQLNIYHNGWIDFNKNGKMDVFEDPHQPVEKRVEDLLSQMNVDEKTCQMATLYGYRRVLKDSLPTEEWKSEIWKDGIANIDEQLNGVVNGPQRYYSSDLTYPPSNHAAAINKIQKWFVEQTRLGIPVDFTNEGVHGLNHDRATPLPAPISIGSTWDRKLVYEAGQIEGTEAKALGYTNIYAPILDVSRDPRWGRVVETYGEDPYLISELGIQMVDGIQSEGVGSTIKHYAVYSVPKGGRDGNARTDPHVAPRELHEMFLYPFAKVVEKAHPVGAMASYNDWDGVPIIASYYFLTQLLRQQFGFTGYVVSDSQAVEFVFSKHHVAGNLKDAIKQVVEAGLNVHTNFSPPKEYILPLRELIKDGSVNMETINKRVADVLRVKFELGLFDHPYVKDVKAADSIVGTAHHEDLVMQMEKESLVLLKNIDQTLPLNKNKLKKIFVTGPLAAETNYAISRYGPNHIPVTSVLEGIKEYLGNTVKVNYLKGCDVVNKTWPESEIIHTPLTKDERRGIDQAVKEARKNDVIIAVLGEDVSEVGEGLSRSGLDLPGRQEQLLEALQATGKPVVLVLINGQPLTINWADKYVPAILEAWFPNQYGGKAIAQTLFGDYNPGGKLSITFPKTTGQIEMNFPFKPGSQADQGVGGFSYGNTRVNGPLYPFGYGLSYTTFKYSNLVVKPTTQKQQGNIEVSVDVTNTGTRKGDEIVQLYVHQKVASVTVYDSQLRGFERVPLNPGETKTVHFTLHPEDLQILDRNMNWTVEPGEFELRIGASSTDIKLKKDFTIIKAD